MTTPQAIQRVLTDLERWARQTNSEAGYSGLLNPPALPMDTLAEMGTLTRMDDLAESGAGQDAVPSLLVGDSRGGQAQIEICPFGSLALIVSDGDMDTDPVAQALLDADITPLFPNDLDHAGEWHGKPLGRWLFPRRWSEALAMADELRHR